MKKDEVPQDEGFLIEGKIRDLCYATDNKGHYTQVMSKGWAPKNDAMRFVWHDVYKNADETRKRVISGELSPIAFYMELNVMNVGMLAGYMNLSKRKVKSHMKMKVFKKLKNELIARYAEVFQIDKDNLTQVDKLKEIDLTNENRLST